jgi:hypothetical protein
MEIYIHNYEPYINFEYSVLNGASVLSPKADVCESKLYELKNDSR